MLIDLFNYSLLNDVYILLYKVKNILYVIDDILRSYRV